MNDKRWWDLQFKITPSMPIISLDKIWQDFVEHMREIEPSLYLDSNNPWDVYSPETEFEVYCTSFNRKNRKEGIEIKTGRSAPDIADEKFTRKLFEEFTAKYQQGYVPLNK